jgi:hypothetical protein
MCSAVGNSPPFWNESPLQTFYAPQTKILETRKAFWTIFLSTFLKESPKTSAQTLEIVPKQAVQNVFRVSKIVVWGAYIYSKIPT